MSNSVYTSPGCDPIHAGIAQPQRGFYNTIASWMHQRFFQFNSTIAYYPISRNDNTMTTHACNGLRQLTLRDPVSLLGGRRSFTTNRRRAARILLVRMAEHPWPFRLAQLALRELIDLAHITTNVGLPRGGYEAALQRYANLTLLFTQSPVTVTATTRLPQVNGGSSRLNNVPSVRNEYGIIWAPLRLSPLHLERAQEEAASAAAEEVEINLDDEDEEDNVIDVADDSVNNNDNRESPVLRPVEIVISDTEETAPPSPPPSTSQPPRRPPCCSTHTMHCCCCANGTGSSDTQSSQIQLPDISPAERRIFEAFIRYHQWRKHNQRQSARVFHNRPSSPIVISDDDGEVEVTGETMEVDIDPQPGPSMPRVPTPPQVTEDPEVMIDETPDFVGDRKPLLIPPSPQHESIIDRPQTASAFYALVRELVNGSSASTVSTAMVEAMDEARAEEDVRAEPIQRPESSGPPASTSEAPATVPEEPRPTSAP